MSTKKIPAPMKSRRKKMSRLELVIGNWMLGKAEEQGFTRDPADIYTEGIQLADQIRKHFKIQESA